MEDILIIAYEEGYKDDVSLLMVSRQKSDGGMEILKLFKEDEADDLYKKLTTV